MKDKIRHIPYYGSVALLVYMPFHIFLSQWLSTFTGGLDIWKGAKEGVAFGLLLIAVCLVALQHKKTPRIYWYLVLAGCVYGLLHTMLYLTNKDTSLGVAGLATAYNCRILAYVIIGFSAVLLSPEKLQPRKIIKTVLVVSTVVCVLGLLQFVLPKDILTHFGYSVERGVKPGFYIDNKPDLVRLTSTIREPNSLGAYLIVPIIFLVAAIRRKAENKKMLLASLLGLHGLILVLTFSRSAFIGLVVSATIFMLLIKGAAAKEMLGKYLFPLCLIILVLAGTIFLLRDQYFVQNIVFHSDENTVSAQDSNDNHWFYAKEGLKAIVAQPMGYGPGTAGPVSLQNAKGGFITENYFLQIGYEVGVLGLGLFSFVLAMIVRGLFRIKTEFSNVLLASFFGLTVINLLLHAWVNEAVAVQWWLLAGFGLGICHNRNSHNKKS